MRSQNQEKDNKILNQGQEVEIIKEETETMKEEIEIIKDEMHHHSEAEEITKEKTEEIEINLIQDHLEIDIIYIYVK